VREEVVTLKAMWREIGRTVRIAMRGTPETVRLISILIAMTVLLLVAQSFR
jgi:hypothetical protein